jgi:hypothetical protein
MVYGKISRACSRITTNCYTVLPAVRRTTSFCTFVPYLITFPYFVPKASSQCGSTTYKLTDSDITGRRDMLIRPRFEKGYTNVLHLGNTVISYT